MTKPYYDGATLLILNIAIGLGTFIQILDTSIANVAIPYIAGNLSVSNDQGTWVITSFSASNAVVLPLTGWLSNYFGRVRLFVYSIVLFAITSFLCGFSSSLTMLVFFRVLQGAVAGSLIPLSQSLLLINSPPEKRGGALGFWAMVVIVAPVVGPVLGGYLTEEYSWPWVFYINVPIGLFSAAIIWILLKDRESEIQRDPIDWTGLVLLSIGVACLQIMLDKGQDLDWFRSNVIVALLIISIITLLYYAIWNYYEPYPIVDFSFFKDRNFFYGTIITTIGYLVFFGSIVTLPLWLQTQQGYTAFWAGIAVAPIGIIPLFFSSWVGKNMYRFDHRSVVALSFALFSAGFFLMTTLTTDVSLEVIMFYRFLLGAGLTIFFIPLIQLSLAHVPPEKYASASGLFNFIRILVGSGFGTSLSIALWNRLEIFHHSRLTEAATVYSTKTRIFYETAAANGMTGGVADRVLDRLIEQQAYMLATNDLSWLGAWIFLIMVPIPYLCDRIEHKSDSAMAAAE